MISQDIYYTILVYGRFNVLTQPLHLPFAIKISGTVFVHANVTYTTLQIIATGMT